MQCGSVSVLVLLLAACGTNHAAPDAVAGDATVDGALDAAVDALPDAPPDAQDTTPQPACTTAPKLLIDTSPRQIGNIARSGNTLYVAAWELTNTGVANPAIIAIDLTTEQPTTYTMSGAIGLWTGDGDVYASEVATGTIWTLHDATAPVATVEHLTPGPGAATSDAGYIYWSDGMHIVRRLIAGGNVDTVVTCPSPHNLIVVGTELYCEFSGIVQHSAKTGGMQMPVTGPSGFPITSSLVPAGGKLYYTTSIPMPEIYAIDPITHHATSFDPMTVGHYNGLAASADYFYIADGLGLRRMDRVAHASTIIAPITGGSQMDPVLWNGQVYFEAPDPQAPGMRHVMHCVD